MILDGKKQAQEILANLKKDVAKINKKLGFEPVLATILVGSDAASKTYINMKVKTCKNLGFNSLKIELPKDTTTKKLVNQINKLNSNPSVAGILLQHPVPKHINEQLAFNTIAPHKDVDGVNTLNYGNMAMGLQSFKSATPLGIMLLLEKYNIELEGKNALVIGRSPILGKPVAAMLTNKNATVTLAHSKTVNLPKLIKKADIVVACVGKPEFVKTKHLKKGVVVIDAGYNKGNIGDVEKKGLSKKASYYTPVPGGVGPMTIASLMIQTVMASKQIKKPS